MSDVTRVTETFTPAIANQIALVRLGRRKHVFHGKTLCSRCYGPKPGGRVDPYCAPCWKIYMQGWRAKYSKARRG